ncbi:hypothetical protein RFN58_00945 [Streptomyces iakyrus]|nr:hypothetical protein [Streptomyces iakyrus]
MQTVTEQSNPLLAELLRQFTELTGIPCLINFLKTEMDHLFLGNFLVSRI